MSTVAAPNVVALPSSSTAASQLARLQQILLEEWDRLT